MVNATVIDCHVCHTRATSLSNLLFDLDYRQSTFYYYIFYDCAAYIKWGETSIDDDVGRSNNRWLSFIDLIYFVPSAHRDTNKFIS